MPQIPQTACTGKPAVAGQIPPWRGHTGNHRADDRRAHDPTDAQIDEQMLEAQFAHRGKRDMLNADGTGLHQIQAARQNLDEHRCRNRSSNIGRNLWLGFDSRLRVRARARIRGELPRSPSSRHKRIDTSPGVRTCMTSGRTGSPRCLHHPLGNQPCDVMLCGPLDSLRHRLIDQGILRAQQLLDARAQRRPALARQRKMASEIEPRHLPYRATDTTGLDQAVGEITLTRGGVVGSGSADKQGGRVWQKPGQKPPVNNYYGTKFHQKNAGIL